MAGGNGVWKWGIAGGNDGLMAGRVGEWEWRVDGRAGWRVGMAGYGRMGWRVGMTGLCRGGLVCGNGG